MHLAKKIGAWLGLLGHHHHHEHKEGEPYYDTSKYTDDQNAIFKKFTTIYDTQLNETKNQVLEGLKDWQMPKWAEGMFFTSGPTIELFNGIQYNHLFDGMGRFSSFNMKNGQVSMTSNVMQTKYWQQCQKEKDVPPSLLFAETTPARWKSKVPGMNMHGQLTYGDNNWVAIERLPDKKTFYTSTDANIKVEMDIEELEVKNWLKFDDDLKCTTGVTHSQTMKDGTMVSMCQTVNASAHGVNYPMSVYRMTKENPKKREILATIPMDNIYFFHSLRTTDNYTLIYQAPIWWKNMAAKMVAGFSMKDIFYEDPKGTTKIHVVRHSDGHVTTIDTKQFIFIYHFSNAWQIDNDNKIVVEGPTYTTGRGILNFLRENYMSMEFMTNLKQGSQYQRMTIDIEAGTFDVHNFMTLDYGVFDLPNYNPHHEGKEHQYTYITNYWSYTSMTEDYHYPILKFDSKANKVVEKFALNATLTQECRFIPDPNGSFEDDGLLIFTGTNFMEGQTSLFIVDPHDMSVLQQYPLPFRLPHQFHSNWYPSHELQSEIQLQEEIKQKLLQ